MLTGALSSVALAADEKKEVSATAAPQFPRADPPLFIDVSNKCPVTKSGQDDSPMLLIAGALLKPLVDTVVPAATGWLYDKGVQALAKHNEKKTSSSTAVQTTMLYSPDAKKFSFGCITLIRAPHGRAESDNYLKLSKDLNAKLSADSPWHAIDKDSAIGKLNLARVPDFYMELTLGSEKSSPAPVAPAAAKKTPRLKLSSHVPYIVRCARAVWITSTRGRKMASANMSALNCTWILWKPMGNGSPFTRRRMILGC